jgi:hypothetical protein
MICVQTHVLLPWNRNSTSPDDLSEQNLAIHRGRPAWRTSITGLRVAGTRRWCVLWQKTLPGSSDGIVFEIINERRSRSTIG